MAFDETRRQRCSGAEGTETAAAISWHLEVDFNVKTMWYHE